MTTSELLFANGHQKIIDAIVVNYLRHNGRAKVKPIYEHIIKLKSINDQSIRDSIDRLAKSGIVRRINCYDGMEAELNTRK